MTQEDKELLLKDLCVRLPYGVKLQKTYETSDPIELYSIDLDNHTIKFYKYKGKRLTVCTTGDIERFGELRFMPYLFPISSMTEKQKEEMSSFDPFKTDEVKTLGDWAIHLVDFYNKYHFDYHNLIEKGLALDATGKNIY